MKAMQMAQLRRANAEERSASVRAAIDAALRTLAAAAVSAALGFGAWQAWQWGQSAPLFALREVRFAGLAHANEGELMARSGLALGENLFRVDLARAARGMQSHPWVESARLERRPPGTILASIAEHKPAALVQLGALYVLDEQGRLFKRAAPEDGLDLPLITGLSRESWQDQPLRLFAALHLLDTWQAGGFALAALSEVRLDDGGGFTLFARDGAGSAGAGGRPLVQEIRLGSTDISLKLKRLAQVRAALARRGEQAARIDLDNPARPDQAAATLADKR